MRKTKIICTMGPATRDENVLRQLMLSGMAVARFNFSHGDHASHKEMLDKVVRLREELGLPIATMLDTKGPEIRLGIFKEGKVLLKKGRSLHPLRPGGTRGMRSGVSISYPGLAQDVSEGSTILLDDGLIGADRGAGGRTGDIALPGAERRHRQQPPRASTCPGAHLSMPFISAKDREDILFGIQSGFDFIAASFVRTRRGCAGDPPDAATRTTCHEHQHHCQD